MESEVPKETAPLVAAAPQPEKKPFQLSKWHVVTVVLVVIIIVQALLYVSLTMRYNSLNSQHQSLLSEHKALEGNHSSLESSYSSLQSSYSSLQSDYNGVLSDYDSLDSSYDSLQSSYDSLRASYDSLQTSYDILQSSFDSYYSDYASLRSLVNQRALQLDVMDFVTPNDAAVNSTVLSVTGGWSSPSDWDEYWSDMKKMYDWVVNNVEYRYDGLFPILPSTPSGSVQYSAEMWQFPNETLDLRKGDCEDMAILLASMIRSYNGGKYWVECILIVGSLSGHAAVQVPVTGDKLAILDPAGHYYTQDSGGNLVSKDISTEINSWLNYWKPQMGSDIRVEGVFSDYIDKSFSSTSEYTSWMYSR